MMEQDRSCPTNGWVELDDACLGRERSRGKRGRGAPGKTPSRSGSGCRYDTWPTTGTDGLFLLILFSDRIAELGADDVAVRDISDATVGFGLAGPRSRDVLAKLTHQDVSRACAGRRGAPHPCGRRGARGAHHREQSIRPGRGGDAAVGELPSDAHSAAKQHPYLLDASLKETTGIDSPRVSLAISTRCWWCVKKSTWVFSASCPST